MILRVCAFLAVVQLVACDSLETNSLIPANNGVGLVGETNRPLTAGNPRGPSARAINTGTAPVLGVDDQGRPPIDGAVTGLNGPGIATVDDGRRVSINFVNADIQEFVRAVFDETLKETVIVDPTLTGKITIRTSEPIAKQAAMDLVQQVLDLNNATLSKSGAVYRVTARSQARTPGQSGGNIKVIPVRYMDPQQAKDALLPFLPQGAQITANNPGRFLVVSGSVSDLNTLEQAIANFDIDQMRGKTIAMIPLREANSEAVAKEVETMFVNDGQKSLKVIAIDRLNAVMLIGSNSSSLSRAKQWIMHLDQPNRDDRQVHIYPVQFRKAAEIADVIAGMFAPQGQDTSSAKSSPVAPGLTPVKTQLEAGTPKPTDAVSTPSNAQSDDATSGQTSDSRVQIKADPATNSLIIIASQTDYERVIRTVHALDVQPSQILIEATIAEVQLNSTLSHGVQWYLQSGQHSIGLTSSAAGDVSPSYPGFNYTFQVANSHVIISALEAVTKVEIVSSPALTVVNNQSATLNVGDEVPIITRSASSISTPDAPIVNDVQLKDTGIILTVTPRVNASGLVGLDISQEVSEVVPTTSSTIDSPTIRQRKIKSSVAVPSGTEIVLGGLISSQKNANKSGVPILGSMPVVGDLFTSENSKTGQRTELLIIIRPTVIGSTSDIANVSEEIKRKLEGATSSMYH